MKLSAQLAAALLAASLAAPAAAGPLTVSTGGTFTADTVSSFFTAPGATWSFSLVIDEVPTPIPEFTLTDFYTTLPFSSFEYRLNGVAIAESAELFGFYNAGNGGGMEIVFTRGDLSSEYMALTFYGPQMYSGDEFTPTILPGSYDTFNDTAGDENSVVAYVGGVAYLRQGPVTIDITRVPAPQSLALALAALGLLVTSSRRLR